MRRGVFSRMTLAIVALSFGAICASADPVTELSEPTIKFVKRMANGAASITIDGEDFLAITPKMAEQDVLTIKALEKAEGKLALIAALLESYQKLVASGEGALAKREELVEEMESQIKDYKRLVAKYRLIKAPLVSIELGGGYESRSSLHIAAMAGLGWGPWRLWGIASKDGWSAMGGASIPLW